MPARPQHACCSCLQDEGQLRLLQEKNQQAHLVQLFAQAEQELQQQPGLMSPVPPAQMLALVLQEQQYAGHSFQQLLHDMPELLQRAAQKRVEAARQPEKLVAQLMQQTGLTFASAAAGPAATSGCTAAGPTTAVPMPTLWPMALEPAAAPAAMAGAGAAAAPTAVLTLKLADIEEDQCQQQQRASEQYDREMLARMLNSNFFAPGRE